MADDALKSAVTAQVEIARLVVARAVAGKVVWQNDGAMFSGFLGQDLRIEFDGNSSQLVESANWDKFIVLEGENTLVNFRYPSVINKVQGYRVCPDSLLPALDQLFAELRRELIDEKYGSALSKLRSLG